MDPITRQAIAVAGAGGAGDSLYVDDVFSTFLYDGNGSSTQTINNGIDLSGEGGMVWIKCRSASADHRIVDTERGANNTVSPNSTGANGNYSSVVSSINSNGFTVATDATTNWSGRTYVSWSFRKAPGFFDVVTYTGNGSAGHTISHSLGSVPGMIIIKNTSNSESWQVWHRSVTGNLELDNTGAANTSSVRVNSVTSTSFDITSAWNTSNANGQTYVAYIFAHDDQSFGTNSDEAIIKCGSYAGNGSSTGPSVNLGFEPQWLLIKSATGSNAAGVGWYLFDNMRGLGAPGIDDKMLSPNTTGADSTGSRVGINSTGFTLTTSSGVVNGTSTGYIYMAIRRPHKPPTAGTEVFFPKAWTGTQSSHSYDAGFPMDLIFHTHRGGSSTATWIYDRLRGSSKRFISSTTSPEDNANFLDFDKQNSVGINGSSSGYNSNSENYIHHVFRRAPGFFDVVAYTGDAVAGRTVAHNLGVAPEMMMVLQRTPTPGTTSAAKLVYASFLGNQGVLQIGIYGNNAAVTGNASWYNTTPTATSFTLNGFLSNNGSGITYIAYLFASLNGISKVGSYTGTGYNVDVDCGFTSGARFVLIKRTDATGDWYFWDTARGIVSGNEPLLHLNQNYAENLNDYIDPLNAGFTVTSSAPAALNASGGTYLFLAIA